MALRSKNAKLSRFAFVATFMVAIVFLPAQLLHACSCGVGPACSDLWRASAVFSGRVIHITTHDRITSNLVTPGPRSIRLQVIESFRGVPSGEVTVETGASTCAYPFKLGERYLVYANYQDGRLTTSICSRTAPLDASQPEIETIRSLLAQPPASGSDLYGKVGHVVPPKEHGMAGELIPLPGIRVTATSNSSRVSVATNEEGNYRFDKIPAGDYLVKANLPGYLTKEPVRTRLSDRGCSEVNFEGFSSARIRGRVIDAGGKPAARIQVQAIPWNDRGKPYSKQVGVQMGYTGPDGRYEVKDLEPGDYMLAASLDAKIYAGKPEYPPTYFPSVQKLDDAQPVAVGQGSMVENIGFILSPPVDWLEVPISATWSDGSPARAAEIFYSPRSMGYLFLSAPRTDVNGKAFVRMLDNTDYLVCVKIKMQSGKMLVSDAVAFTATRDAPPIRTVLHAPMFECSGYRSMAGAE